MQECVSGIVDHIIFRNEDNGYTVLELTGEGENLTLVGYFADVREGLGIEARGTYTEHMSYGRQFKVESYEYREPETKEAMELYLGSGAVKGIGKALAERIVKRFGEDSIRILEEEPERLAEVKGISMRKAREIGEAAAGQAGVRRAMVFLEGFGISLKMSVRIYREYGEEIYTILRENPYRLAEDIEGIGFLTADRIAARAGIAAESEYRVRSGILYALARSTADGHVYLPEDMLLDRAAELLGVGGEVLQYALEDLILSHRVTAKSAGEERRVYLSQYYYLELNAARKLLDLRKSFEEDAEENAAFLARITEKSGISLEEEQRRAVLTAAEKGVMILTGGPGTGKTTTMGAMIRFFEARHMRVLLAAPTGRAAKRMTETTKRAASTIHRLLEISSGAEEEMERVRFERNEENPLEADAVIIDEMSMVDIFLFHALLMAVAPGTRLILIGDVNQLPSVGAGSVLRDILKSGAFSSVSLTKIFRQAATSDIVVNAHRINAGDQIALDNKSRDFFFLRRGEPDRIIRNSIELIRDRLPSYVHAEPFDIQVLAPMRKGPLGVERLNTILQEYLNPPSRKKNEKPVGDRIFREGDKVMQTRNNYELEYEVRGKYGIPVDEGCGIFNGDMGIIRRIDEFGKYMEIEFDEKRMVDYPFPELEDLELAYAVTIHKSQGSEYPAVILPLLSGPPMLMTRNLLYTAVTRARECVVILGSEETVRGMIRNETELRRFTSLDERIGELA